MSLPDDSSSTTTDRRAFEILVRQHHRRLMGYAISICNREDAAKDIVQESLVAAWENLDKFDVSKNFGAWVRGIVRNKAREWARAQNLVALDEDVLDVLENQHRRWDLSSETTDESIFQILGECIKKLPDLLSQAVNLFYFRGLSGAETAEQVGADPATVRKRLERSRKNLRECMEKSLPS